MRTTDFFEPVFVTEASRNMPLIVVDVQPAYESWVVRKFPPMYLAEFMNRHNGPILMFVNAEQEGMTEDTKNSIYYWWIDNGMDPDVWERSNFTYYDKGYGYMRSWMDYGKDPSTIIRTIRYMFQKKVWDSRDIDPEELEEVVGPEWNPWMEDDPLFVNWVGIDLLRRHSGYICGGGRHECLREVTLMMNAFNIKYKMLERFVYG